MIKDDSVYLRHILDAIYRIEEYTQSLEYQAFMSNYLVQDGVIRQIAKSKIWLLEGKTEVKKQEVL